MNSILRRHKHENKSARHSAASTATSSAAAAAPISPASTVYHDPFNANENDNHIIIQEPTPNYEPHQHPAFPEPQHYPPTTLVDNQFNSNAVSNATAENTDANVKVARSDSIRSNGNGNTKGNTSHPNSYPSSVDENTVLGQQNVEVQRSGTWAKGPGTSGIREDLLSPSGHPSRHASLAERASTASRAISPEKETILSKAEMKDAKRLSKIIKAEGKAEDKQFKSALKELASLQVAQKKASAVETAATHAQIKAEKEEQRATAAYLEARVRLEKARANLKVCEERMELTKDNAEKTTGMVRRQAMDVEAMRERKATDDREREVKLAELKAKMVN